MTNAVRNDPCNAVTRDVRGCVQNQNQNQTVVTSVLGISNHLSIHRHLGDAARPATMDGRCAAIGGGR